MIILLTVKTWKYTVKSTTVHEKMMLIWKNESRTSKLQSKLHSYDYADNVKKDKNNNSVNENKNNNKRKNNGNNNDKLQKTKKNLFEMR